MSNNKDFVRSETNKGAILNVNNEALTAYKRAREIRWKTEEQGKKIDKVEEELSEIKILLQKILEKAGE
jgi:hypothetical protein